MYDVGSKEIIGVKTLLINRYSSQDCFYLHNETLKTIKGYYDYIFYDCNLYIEKNTVKVVGKKCNIFYPYTENLFFVCSEHHQNMLDDPEFESNLLDYEIGYSKRFFIFGEKLKTINFKKVLSYVESVNSDIKTYIYTNSYLTKIINFKKV